MELSLKRIILMLIEKIYLKTALIVIIVIIQWKKF